MLLAAGGCGGQSSETTSRRLQALRSYQERGVADIRVEFARGARAVLYQAPTGSGKTVLFAYLLANAVARGNRVVILGHRQEIVDQIDTALTGLAVPHGIIAAGHVETPDMPVQVASVATLVRRLDRLRHIDLLVIDEAHHAVAGTWRAIINTVPDARILGVTATPERLDGQGLGDIFEALIGGPTVADLIEGKFLSKFTAYAPARDLDLSGIRTRMGDFATDQLAGVMSGTMVIGSAVEEYTRLCPGAPAIAFCVDIKHSKLVADRFAKAGYRAAHVDGDTPRDERRKLIHPVATGEIQVLSNCGLISEGLDVPDVVAAILLRPTQSLALYLQQVGRALRPTPGKNRALILDHAGNTHRHGPADATRAWSLDGKAKTRAPAPAVRRCKECGALNSITAEVCEACGAELYRKPPVIRTEVATGTLIEIERLKAMPYGQALRWAGNSEHRLRLIAAARGYKPGWVYYRLQELRGQGGHDRRRRDRRPAPAVDRCGMASGSCISSR
jgi:superfamily II DNA or RNA helicase